MLRNILVPLCSVQVRAEKDYFEAFPTVSLQNRKQLSGASMRQIAGGSWQGGRITYSFLFVVIYRS